MRVTASSAKWKAVHPVCLGTLPPAKNVRTALLTSAMESVSAHRVIKWLRKGSVLLALLNFANNALSHTCARFARLVENSLTGANVFVELDISYLKTSSNAISAQLIAVTSA